MTDDECGAVGGMRIARGNRSTRRKPAPVPLVPPKNPTRPDLGSNPGRRGGKPASNRLSYGKTCTLDKSCMYNKIFELASLFPVVHSGEFLLMN
jgi:hypothetical protein